MEPYRVLQVNEYDSYDTIKSSFQNLARQYHPDKTGNSESLRFVEIQDAWNAIKERVENKTHGKGVSSEIVLLTDLERSPCGEFYIRTCRCGSVYEVYIEDLDAGYNTFQCTGCSLHITVDEGSTRKES
mmetsp:Transcript_22685/g.33153  ORF Transcript_22685/g.33153 Transcript_22685/m.33153 type:complete len:129 (-) Transcript_22685:156-542(-)